MALKMLYFAWLRSKLGLAAEEVAPPPEVRDVAGLMNWMRGRGPRYEAALADPALIRVAVNQTYARPHHPVADGDEVALFPPVTGG